MIAEILVLSGNLVFMQSLDHLDRVRAMASAALGSIPALSQRPEVKSSKKAFSQAASKIMSINTFRK